MTRAEALRADDAAERVRALADVAASAAALTPDELDALGECLADSRKLVQRRAADACAALLGRDTELRARLLAALRADDARLRWGAAYALGLVRIFSADTVLVLTEVMGGDDGDLRWAALDLFKRFAAATPAGAVDHLLQLASAGTPQQRKMALYGLRDLEVDDGAAVDAAVRALECRQTDVRLAAMSLLARISTDRARTAALLLELLHDADPVIPRAAAASLGALGERSATVIAALEQAQAGADPGLQRAAARSLRLLARAEE